MPHDLVDEPFDVALECSGNGRAMEAALAQLKRAGHARARRRGHRARRSSTTTASCSNELVITGAFVYDDDGFPRALELLASGKVPHDVLVEAEDVPLDGLLDAAIGLHEGAPRGEGDDRPPRPRERHDIEHERRARRSATRKPRFNHVAMSLPPDLLDEEHRKLLVDFYADVFGFDELPMLTEDRHRLVFQVHNIEQFVFLIADDDADDVPAARPLRALGRRGVGARRHPGARQGVAGA